MPIKIKIQTKKILSLEDFCSIFENKILNKNFHICLMAEDLAALGRNRRHLCELISHKLINLKASTNSTNLGHSLVLARGANYLIRLVTWDLPQARNGIPSLDEDFYSYGFIHNHNFDLLTVGILGPGYKTLNWRLDTPPQYLLPGEKILLSKSNDDTLGEGEILFYEKWRDVHAQMPPHEFSMSLNLIIDDIRIPQYSFCEKTSSVLKHIGGAGFNVGRILSIAKAIQHPDLMPMCSKVEIKYGELAAKKLFDYVFK